MLTFLTYGLLAVFAWHFGTVLGWFGTAPATPGEFFWRLGIILVGFFVVSVVTAIKVASGDETAAMPDEREEKIELRAERVGVIVLYLGLLVVVWLAFSPLTPMQFANAVLAAVCAAELIKMTYALVIMNKQL
jgi:hypothetical protein